MPRPQLLSSCPRPVLPPIWVEQFPVPPTLSRTPSHLQALAENTLPSSNYPPILTFHPADSVNSQHYFSLSLMSLPTEPTSQQAGIDAFHKHLSYCHTALPACVPAGPLGCPSLRAEPSPPFSMAVECLAQCPILSRSSVKIHLEEWFPKPRLGSLVSQQERE